MELCYWLVNGNVKNNRINYEKRSREFKQTTTATRRYQTKGLMSKTMAVHVRFESWYISFPSSAKQQREMTKLHV